MEGLRRFGARDIPWLAPVLLVVIGALYATMYLVIGVMAESESVSRKMLTATGLRFLFAGLVLGAVALLCDPALRPSRRLNALSALVGLFLVGSVGLYSCVSKAIPAWVTALIMASWPALLAVLNRGA